MSDRYLCINGFGELQELHAPVTAFELPDDFASGHIPCCESRRCAWRLYDSHAQLLDLRRIAYTQ